METDSPMLPRIFSVISPLAVAFLASAAIAQPASTGSGHAYPNKPIRIIVPYAPGGGADLVARLVGHGLTEAWAQQAIIDFRGGSGGNVGTELAARATADGISYAVTLSVAFGCPYGGEMEASRVLSAAEHLAAGGVEEIMLADTIGVGVPTQVRELVTETLGLGLTVGVHFHNTRNTGYANAVAAVDAGATILDASTGGLGGCPFTPNATGNIATEDLIYLLEGMGIKTGVKLEALFEVSRWLSGQIGADLPGLTYKAGGFAPIAS